MAEEEVVGEGSTEEVAEEAPEEEVVGEGSTEEVAEEAPEEEVAVRKRTGDLIQELDKEMERSDSVDFGPGDTVRVLYNVREGSKERIQAFEGVCIGRRGGGAGETFTVRKISSGIGVERVFPLHAPTVTAIEVMRRGRVRRAKLYYLRNRRGKSARIKEKRAR